MSDDRRRLGAEGEDAACGYLRRLGYRVLARNFSCPTGELDLICYHEDCIVFVEIKTRTHDQDAPPEDNVTAGKQWRMLRAARHWLALHRSPNCAYRFDVVSVVLSPNRPPEVRQIVEAFVPS